MSLAVSQVQRARFPTSSPLHPSALYEGFVFGVVKKCLLRNFQYIREHGNRSFAGKARPALDICDLVYGQLAQFSQFLLTQVQVEPQTFDAYAEIRLYGLYPLHTSKSGEASQLMTPSITTGYSFDILGDDYALEDFSGAKSKKSRTGIPRVIENTSIDSKEGAFSPRSTRLRKSTEILRSSANSSCVMSRSLRNARSLFPNNFRRVATN